VAGSDLWLHDDAGVRSSAFALGQSIFVAGRGLSPSTVYELSLERDHGAALLASYCTDRHGVLPEAVVIPYVGMADHDDERHGRERRIRVTARDSRKRKDSDRLSNSDDALDQDDTLDFSQPHHQLAFYIARDDRSPRVVATDRQGHLETGVERGEGRIGVTLSHFASGCVRIYVVPRQFGWREGDAIEPARRMDGSEAVITTRTTGEHSQYVDLGASTELPPGSYQFIVRPFRPGWFDADEPRLAPGDVVSDRRFASLVIRIPYHDLFGFGNAITLTPRIAGRPLAHRPYFHFLDNFPRGTDVYAALDPDALPPGLLSKRAAIYVIVHKTASDWTTSSALTDVSGPGMTPAPKIVPIVPGCVNWNSTLVWPNPQVPGRYDIAIDFGNNAADPSGFVPDGSLDPPLDMIDGYVRVGFYVTDDPSLPGPYAGSIGSHDYQLGSINVPSTDTGPTPTDSLPMTATIRYPAQSSGVDAPFAAGQFPLVVIMHGNSGMETSYLGYDYLLDHLAGHGFVAMSIYAPVGAFIETRARAILAHLATMAQYATSPGLFQGHLDMTQIGIAGHSRGGEAVVRAARINTAEGLGYAIGAAVSIAPTDYHHYGDAGVPVLVVYGANDGDVAGTWPDRTGFDIFDETGRPRSFVFVYGATHDRFNTEWASIETSVEFQLHITPSDIPQLISLTDHENVAKGYLTAFFQAHLQGRDEQLAYFSDGLKPSLTSALRIHTTHEAPGERTLDDFQQLPHDPSTNSLGGAVTATALSGLAEDELHALDVHSPHPIAGAQLSWTSSAGIYLSDVPAVARDLTAYSVLAFRVTQKYGSAENPANLPQDFFVRVTDGAAKSRAIRVSTFTDIPYPYVRGETDLIKSALKSVRIPLASFVIANLGAEDVDLAAVSSISFEFDAFGAATGEIEINDIEFEV
jgi:dienelactone hydrolase